MTRVIKEVTGDDVWARRSFSASKVYGVSLLAAPDTVTNLALLPQFLDPMYLLTNDGPFASLVLPAILVIVFIETGLLFPILPGDSLLFTGGFLAHTDNPPVSIWTLLILVPIVAVAGDNTSYLIGRLIGPRIFDKEDGRFFKKKYITETHAFFEKYGPKTIILARFVPIVRTFTPVLAGVSQMTYRKFLMFDIIGGIAWGGGVTLLGYALGSVINPKYIEPIFLLIVLVSILPAIVHVGQRMLASRKAQPASDE